LKFINVIKHIAIKGDGPNGLITFDEKELIPDAMFRRKLTRSAKILIYIQKAIEAFDNVPIVLGSNLGEIQTTCKMLKSIINNKRIMPIDFQNSVHNTPQTYSTIMFGNKSEMSTVSCGLETSYQALKCGYTKLLADESIDRLLVIAIETFDEKMTDFFDMDTDDTCECCAAMLLVKSDIQADVSVNISCSKQLSTERIVNPVSFIYNLSVNNDCKEFCVRYV